MNCVHQCRAYQRPASSGTGDFKRAGRKLHFASLEKIFIGEQNFTETLRSAEPGKLSWGNDRQRGLGNTWSSLYRRNRIRKHRCKIVLIRTSPRRYCPTYRDPHFKRISKFNSFKGRRGHCQNQDALKRPNTITWSTWLNTPSAILRICWRNTEESERRTERELAVWLTFRPLPVANNAKLYVNRYGGRLVPDSKRRVCSGLFRTSTTSSCFGVTA